MTVFCTIYVQNAKYEIAHTVHVFVSCCLATKISKAHISKLKCHWVARVSRHHNS